MVLMLSPCLSDQQERAAGGRGGGAGHAVGVDPEALLAAAGAAGDAAATLGGFADLAPLDGADDAGTDGVALAYGDVADGWARRRGDLADDLRTLSAFAAAAVEAITALDGRVVTVALPRS